MSAAGHSRSEQRFHCAGAESHKPRGRHDELGAPLTAALALLGH